MTRTGGNQPLAAVWINMGAPIEVIRRLEEAFPEVRFMVPGDAIRESSQYSGSPPLPSDEEIQEADALIGWEVPGDVLAKARRLRWIHAAGAGVSHFDLAAIRERGITLTNSSGISAPNMAEHVMGMVIALARRFPVLMRSQQAHRWRDFETHREVIELAGQTMLVIGMGEVGREIAVRAAAFGMRVVGVRRRAEEALPAGFTAARRPDDLLEALADADHVVLAVPETSQTRAMIDARALAAMKPGAMIYNVGRGTAIDTTALVEALSAGRLAGAGLDVTDPEPLPENSPLWEMENVLITAHSSGATPRYWERQGALIVENIARIQGGEPPRNIVDLSAGY